MKKYQPPKIFCQQPESGEPAALTPESGEPAAVTPEKFEAMLRSSGLWLFGCVFSRTALMGRIGDDRSERKDMNLREIED